MSVVFYRGLTMQVAVERDESGRSNYAMCAVNPSRISKTFNEQALQYVVENIADETGWLLEIVNLNVANMQYVCAGRSPRSRLSYQRHKLPQSAKKSTSMS